MLSLLNLWKIFPVSANWLVGAHLHLANCRSKMEMIRAAGMVIYRVNGNAFEYLLLQASYPPFHWTPPKGNSMAFFTFL